MENEAHTSFVQLRLQRTVTQDAYILVPVTEAIMQVKPDGTVGIDVEKFIAAAIELGKNDNVEWLTENICIEAHPIQTPKPDNQTAFGPKTKV